MWTGEKGERRGDDGEDCQGGLPEGECVSMQADFFGVLDYRFPYEDFRFPGQSTDERILYVARESKLLLYLRILGVVASAVVLLFCSVYLVKQIKSYDTQMAFLLGALFGLASVLFLGVGWWWTSQTWRKSVFVVTNRRLAKFIHVTPWNKYSLSVTLDQIVDTGAYSKGYWRALARVGTLTARSSAGNREDKYFFVENVEAAEDLANYVNKVLYHFRRDVQCLDTYRPFIKDLKGENRKVFVKEKYPHFWS